MFAFSLTLDWRRPDANAWYTLGCVDVYRVTDSGVCIAWLPGRFWLHVGGGPVGAQLAALRDDERLARFGPVDSVHVTWACVSPALQGGVERYLAWMLSPLLIRRRGSEPPIEVNLPVPVIEDLSIAMTPV